MIVKILIGYYLVCLVLTNVSLIRSSRKTDLGGGIGMTPFFDTIFSFVAAPFFPIYFVIKWMANKFE